MNSTRTKPNNSLTNALVKHEAEHVPNIFENNRRVTSSYKLEVVL